MHALTVLAWPGWIDAARAALPVLLLLAVLTGVAAMIALGSDGWE